MCIILRKFDFGFYSSQYTYHTLLLGQPVFPGQQPDGGNGGEWDGEKGQYSARKNFARLWTGCRCRPGLFK